MCYYQYTTLYEQGFSISLGIFFSPCDPETFTMSNTETSPDLTVRNNRILRRAIIPKKYHHAAKLMAKSLNTTVGELYDRAVISFISSAPECQDDYLRVGRKNNPPKVSFWLAIDVSNQAKRLATQRGITEHEVLLSAIVSYAKKHRFDRIKI